MPCHQTPHHRVILINCIYGCRLFFIADDNKWYPARQILDFFLKIRMRIACINNSLRIDRTDHPEIFFFLSGIPLRVADKNTVAFFRLLRIRYPVKEGRNMGLSASDRSQRSVFLFWYCFYFCGEEVRIPAPSQRVLPFLQFPSKKTHHFSGSVSWIP